VTNPGKFVCLLTGLILVCAGDAGAQQSATPRSEASAATPQRPAVSKGMTGGKAAVAERQRQLDAASRITAARRTATAENAGQPAQRR
jgi:hypothetical protein